MKSMPSDMKNLNQFEPSARPMAARLSFSTALVLCITILCLSFQQTGALVLPSRERARVSSVSPIMPSTFESSDRILTPSISILAISSSTTLKPSMRSSTTLFHMGHSHSHHHHDHGHSHHHDHSNEEEENTPLTPQQKRKRLSRRIMLVAAVWLGTCGVQLLLKRRLARSDWFSFGMASITLSSADRMRRAIRQNVQKLGRLRDGIVKHSPRLPQEMTGDPGVSYSSSSVSSVKLREAREADRVTWIGAIINLVLSVGKLVVGVTQHSSALVADAGHSLSDLVSDFITLWTVKIARLPADEDHPYGHWKFEAIGSLFLSLTLIATAVSVGVMANKQLLEILHQPAGAAVKAMTHHHGHSHGVLVPGKLALLMAALSIASKEWLYRITMKVGEKIRSQVVIANAWHHRSDAYSSVLALASIAWARTGVVAADAAAGLLVAGMIGMTGGEILMESVQQLSDGATPWLQKECAENCKELLEKDSDDVDGISFVKARQVGSLSLVDVELLCPTNLSTTAARAVEQRWKFWLHQMHGYEATVHAKPNDVICPLLLQQQDTDIAAPHSHDSSDLMYNQSLIGMDENSIAVPLIVTTSAGMIENLAREQVRIFGGGSQVERVTVHYNPGCETSVDIILSSPPLSSSSSSLLIRPEETLPNLVQNGTTIKESLQSLMEIDKANIYWDLSSIPLPCANLAP